VVEVGLVGIASVGGHLHGGVPPDQAVDGVIETDQHGGAFGRQTDLRAEA
jgi:hypothetical protein